MSLAYWLNTAWMCKCIREGRTFRRATSAVAETQADVLRRILSQNQRTEYGICHDFAQVKDPRQYQQRVPLSDYDTYRDPIERIADGQTGVLTKERVELFEPTSGTTRGQKLIPYTASLRREFQRGIAAWIANVMQHRPEVRRGRAYWSISPALGQPRATASGIPVGFADDAEYLGGLERIFLKYLLIMPSAVAKFSAIENFRYCTLLYLVSAADLSLISIWNPTFLTSLLSSLEDWSDRICLDLRRGTVSLPVSDDRDIVAQLRHRIQPQARRAERVSSTFRANSSMPEKVQLLWPQLALISCWTDAAAAAYVSGVKDLFPNVAIQPKGLLATEGCVSIPLVGRPGTALAIRSHFFEFAEFSTSHGDREVCQTVYLAHELEQGRRYKVIMTTGGGLYRYQLHDVVEVVGFEKQCPLLKFVGRANQVSDLVGEKLSEPHVHEVLKRVFAARGLSLQFSMVVPVPCTRPYYRLYLQGNDTEGLRATSHQIENEVEKGLEENPYYRYAVQLQQLGPLEVRILDGNHEPAWLVYERQSLARGQEPGNIKPTVLAPWNEWVDQFEKTQETKVAVARRDPKKPTIDLRLG